MNWRPVVKVKRADAWDMRSKIPMTSGTFNAQHDTKIDTCPVRIWKQHITITQSIKMSAYTASLKQSSQRHTLQKNGRSKSQVWRQALNSMSYWYHRFSVYVEDHFTELALKLCGPYQDIEVCRIITSHGPQTGVEHECQLSELAKRSQLSIHVTVHVQNLMAQGSQLSIQVTACVHSQMQQFNGYLKTKVVQIMPAKHWLSSVYQWLRLVLCVPSMPWNWQDGQPDHKI